MLLMSLSPDLPDAAARASSRDGARTNAGSLVRWIVLGLAGIATTTLASCAHDGPVDPSPAPTLTANVAALEDSAIVGRTLIRSYVLELGAAGDTLAFGVTAVRASSWISLGATPAVAPGTFAVEVNTSGLAVGDHHDTLRFTVAGSAAPPLRVPVLLRIRPLPVGTLSSSPAAIVDSAVVGSIAPKPHEILLGFVGTGPWVNVGVRAARASHWLLAGTQTAVAPGAYGFSFDPSGLPVGEYVDTLSFLVEGSNVELAPVVVRFRVLPCVEQPFGPIPGSIVGELTTDDCTSARFPNRYAARYRFAGTAHDTLTIEFNATDYGETLALERAGVATPIESTATCANPIWVACLRYVVLPATDDYVLELTSWYDRQTGPFALVITTPRAPDAPTGLVQISRDDISDPPGAVIAATNVHLAGFVSDPDRDAPGLEVELLPVGTPFSGVPTHSTPPGPGTRRTLTASGLVDGVSYKWRARAFDFTGRVGPWTEFGGNAPDAADFTVVMQNPPVAPVGLVQRRSDGITAISTGGVTNEPVVRLGATLALTDPSLDGMRLEVEVRPVGVAFTNTMTHASAFVPSYPGARFVEVTVSGLALGTGYRWQARGRSGNGALGPWVPFGSSAVDFEIVLTPP